MTDKKNILILHSDQFRFDAMSCAGNAFMRTPHLDALAAESARFSNAYTLWPLCTPSRAATWTGRYPHNNGITYNIVYGHFDEADAMDAVPNENTTFFEYLQRAGYRTGYIGKWHLGFKRPRYFDHWGGFNSTGSHWVDGLQAHQGGRWLPEAQAEEAIEFMAREKDGDSPFCLTVSWYPPHDPYTAPREFMDEYWNKRVPGSGYYAACAGIDRCVGQMLDGVKALGLEESTLVVFLADHGETFCFRDGVIGNKLVCHDESIRVPFIIRHPGGLGHGTVHDQPVGVHDLAPTLLSYAGVERPNSLDGQDLTPLMQGDATGWRDRIYIENQTSPMQRYATGGRIALIPPAYQRCLRTEKWKLVLSDNGLHSLFDLENDPEELLDIYGAPYPEYYDQYRHYPPMDDTIREVAAMLRDEAERLGDTFGVGLADEVLNNPIKRPEIEDLPGVTTTEMWPH